MNQHRPLRRSAHDRVISGVAGGVAEYFDVDPVLVRILWVISLPFSGFFTAIVYLVMMFVVPLDGPEWQQSSPWQPGGAPVAGAPFAAGTTPPPDGAPAPGAPAAPATPPPADQAAYSGAQYAWETHWQRRAERWERHGTGHSGGLVVGSLLIVVGGLFAWHELDPRVDLGLVWPIAVVAVGVVLIASSVGFHRD